MEDNSHTATILSFQQRQAEIQNSNQSQAAPAALAPPDWLTKRARKHWDEIAPELSKHKITNELDTDMLAVYCSTFARFIDLDIELEEKGMTQKTSTGYEAETGTFTAWNKLLKPIMAYAKQLGMTPPARVAMRLQDPNQTDIFDGF